MFWTLQFWQHPYLGHGQLQKVSTIFTRWIIGVLAKSASSLLWISRGQAPWPALCSYFRLLAELYLRFKASIWYWGKADLGITANEQGSDSPGLDGAQNRSKRRSKTWTWPLERFNEVWEIGVWKFRQKPRFYLVLGDSTDRLFSCLVTCILDTSKRLLFPAPKWGASF